MILAATPVIRSVVTPCRCRSWSLIAPCEPVLHSIVMLIKAIGSIKLVFVALVLSSVVVVIIIRPITLSKVSSISILFIGIVVAVSGTGVAMFVFLHSLYLDLLVVSSRTLLVFSFPTSASLYYDCLPRYMFRWWWVPPILFGASILKWRSVIISSSFVIVLVSIYYWKFSWLVLTPFTIFFLAVNSRTRFLGRTFIFLIPVLTSMRRNWLVVFPFINLSRSISTKVKTCPSLLRRY